MTPKMPRVTGAELLRALKRTGWYEIRISGSHHHLNHQDRPGGLITAPVHAGKLIAIGTLGKILSDAGLTGDELRKLI